MTRAAMPTTAICAPTIERFRGQRSYWQNLLAEVGDEGVLRGFRDLTKPASY